MVITIISGSQNKISITVRIAKFLSHHLKSVVPEAEINIIETRNYNIPLDITSYKNDGSAPEELRSMVDKFYRTDGFILLTPEYNGSYTPAMKNLLNHFPKMHRKPCSIVSASDGALGGMRAAQQLQLLVGAHFGVLSPYMLIVPHIHTKFEEDGTLLDTGLQAAIDKFTEEFLWLLKTIIQR